MAEASVEEVIQEGEERSDILETEIQEMEELSPSVKLRGPDLTKYMSRKKQLSVQRNADEIEKVKKAIEGVKRIITRIHAEGTKITIKHMTSINAIFADMETRCFNITQECHKAISREDVLTRHIHELKEDKERELKMFIKGKTDEIQNIRMIVERGIDKITRSFKEKEAVKEPYSVFIKGKEEQTSVEIKNIIKSQMKEKQINVKIDDVVATKDNSVILKIYDRDSADKLVNKLSESVDIEEKLEVRKPSKRYEKLILLGVSVDTTIETVKADLLEYENVEGDIEIVKLIKRRDGDQNVLIHTTRDIKDKLLSKGKLCIEMNRVRCIQYIRFLRCYRCQGFGHTAFRCKSVVKCAKCAGEHSVQSCIEDIEKCVNCEMDNEHRSDHFDCPAYIKYRRELIAKHL